jgi:Bacterial type II and III secretion system protein
VKSYLVAAAAVLVVALGTPGRAQEQKPSTSTAPTTMPNTLRVQLTVSRYQGEKKISSLPYTMTIHADERNRNVGRANIRLGTQVPITTMSRASGDANAPMVPTVQYRDVGTNIDCIATALEDGRFRLDLTVEDSSVETAAAVGGTPTNPAFKSFRTNDSLLLRDTQSAEFSTATDKVNGDVWKVNVALTIVK